MSFISFGRRRKGPGPAALRDAAQLRRRYGAKAEQWCEIGLAGLTDETRRRTLEDIRQALKETP
ncbi:MAG: hypothetical protein B7Y99_09300 [Caulobacterales bacterium 32-69-10]|nr:MAG: hypothetical protein B7Y99_09300 [Caulobacterales bacterium 32-69-10]